MRGTDQVNSDRWSNSRLLARPWTETAMQLSVGTVCFNVYRLRGEKGPLNEPVCFIIYLEIHSPLLDIVHMKV